VLRWYGSDFGETIMNPYTLHQSELIKRIYSELGRAGEADDRVRRWRSLRDSVGQRTDTAELRVRFLKQYARDRIYREVLDGDSVAIRLYEEGEAGGFTSAKGVWEAFRKLKMRGTAVAVVSETSQPAAALAIVRFLRGHSLRDFVEEIITPAGRFTPEGNLAGPEFAGKTKKDGTIYDELRSYLARRGFGAGESAIIGDDPVLDIANAKARGLVTVQYRGIVDRGVSDADYVIDDWSELPE